MDITSNDITGKDERRTPAEAFAYFKGLEAHASHVLDRTGLHILRLDGRNFSTLTRTMNKPNDQGFADAMDVAALAVAREFNALVGYVASDEISLVLGARTAEQELPFGGAVPKVLSISASCVTAAFNQALGAPSGRIGQFDARVVTVVGRRDVLDYLAWRQADTYRNAVMMAAQTFRTHRELLGVSTRDARALVEERYGTSFEEAFPAGFRVGRQVERITVTEEVTFTDKRTGETRSVVADRSRWVARPAPSYRDLSSAACPAV